MKKNLKKIIASLVLGLSLLNVTNTTVNADINNGWYKDCNNAWFYLDNGIPRTGWQLIDNNWYYFDLIDATMYYDCWIGDYYINPNGIWTTNYVNNNAIHYSSKGNYYEYTNSYSNNASNYTGVIYSGNTCYHYDPDCGGKNSRQITMDEANRRNLRPCKKCVH